MIHPARSNGAHPFGAYRDWAGRALESRSIPAAMSLPVAWITRVGATFSLPNTSTASCPAIPGYQGKWTAEAFGPSSIVCSRGAQAAPVPIWMAMAPLQSRTFSPSLRHCSPLPELTSGLLDRGKLKQVVSRPARPQELLQHRQIQRPRAKALAAL